MIRPLSMSFRPRGRGHVVNLHLTPRAAPGSRADLTGASLTDADLTRANLARADLTEANLTTKQYADARGITKEQWRQTQEGRREEGTENDGS